MQHIPDLVQVLMDQESIFIRQPMDLRGIILILLINGIQSGHLMITIGSKLNLKIKLILIKWFYIL